MHRKLDAELYMIDEFLHKASDIGSLKRDSHYWSPPSLIRETPIKCITLASQQHVQVSIISMKHIVFVFCSLILLRGRYRSSRRSFLSTHRNTIDQTQREIMIMLHSFFLLYEILMMAAKKMSGDDDVRFDISVIDSS